MTPLGIKVAKFVGIPVNDVPNWLVKEARSAVPDAQACCAFMKPPMISAPPFC